MAAANFIVENKTGAELGPGFEATANYGKGIYISFRWTEIRITSTDPEKNGRRSRRLVLTKQPIGDPDTQATSYITPERAAELYPAEWDYFNKHGDMPMVGTALSELPGISVSQIQIMQISGLRSIEDVLSAADEVINRIGHDARYVRSVADEWKKRADDNADLTSFAEQNAAAAAALAAANARADNFQKQAAEMEARLSAMEKLMSGMGPSAQPARMEMVPITPRDEGPDIDSTPNPLAEGTGVMEDDPLN